MVWVGVLVGLLACGPGEETQDTGEAYSTLPEPGSLVEGVTVASFLVVDRVGSEWVEFNTGSTGAVLLPDEELEDHLSWSSEHCEAYTEVMYASSAQGLSPLLLKTSLMEAAATYQDGKYVLEGMDPDPYAEVDSLEVSHQDEVLLEVAAPPPLGLESLGEPAGLGTTLHLAHDDFDGVLVQVYDSSIRAGFCLYGRSDMAQVGGGWELPLVDTGSWDGMPFAAGSTVLVLPVRLVMTDALLPGHPPVPVKAARGLAIPASAL